MANLLELYTHDFCEFIDREIGPDGRFGYPELDTYWNDPDRLPFLLYVANRPAGFALIKALHLTGSMPRRGTWQNFLSSWVSKARNRHRRQLTTWRRFPGRWQVRVMAANEPAYRFWHCAIQSFAGDEFVVTGFQQAGKEWHRFSFES